MKTIATKKAPAAIGPYSQAYTANGFLFTSGHHCRTGGTELQKHRRHSGGCRDGLFEGHQDDLLPGRHEGLCRFQRGV